MIGINMSVLGIFYIVYFLSAMLITSKIQNAGGLNEVTVSTSGNEKKVSIPAKPDGKGSSINGGELLFLSLATCFCNDVYREAAKRRMTVTSVTVDVSGEFGKEGDAGSNITYRVKVDAPGHSQKEIEDLIVFVDRIAEVHNTLRKGVEVKIV